MERTFVAVKPDGVKRGLIGELISRFERKGYKIVALKMIHPTEEITAKHYAEHIGKPFYENLVKFMTAEPLIAMVLSGENAIARVREVNGATNPEKAAEGTIRKLFAESVTKNAVHASDSIENAKREIAIFFSEIEIFD